MPEDEPAPAVDLNEPEGGYHFGIVGESYRQDVLVRFAGERLAAGETVVVPCRIKPEENNQYDANAIGVHIDGEGQVGYFSRDNAAAWLTVRTLMVSSGLDGWCWGYVCGGTADKPIIGVWLNLMGLRSARTRFKDTIDPSRKKGPRAADQS